MTMTLGEYLRKTREDKGLNLAEVAYQTKIREHYLSALENNQMENLPSKVQAKGYLRIYAQLLDLDESQVLQAYDHPDHLVIEKEIPFDDLTVGETQTEPEPKTENETSVEDLKELDDVEEKIDTTSLSTEEPIVHGLDEIESNSDEVLDEQRTISQQIFIGIGEKLKAQRKLLNLSKAEIEQFTSIRPHYLDALEKGALDKLPSIPQARGMLNNYATFLNLDVDQVMIEFAEGLQTKRNENFAPHKIGSDNQLAYKSPEVKKVGWLKFITTDMLLTSVLIIALFIFILWGAANISGFTNNDTSSAEEPPSISDVLLEETPFQLETSSIAEAINLDTTPTSELPTQNIENIGVAEGEAVTEMAPGTSGLPVQVYIIAKQRAYLKVDVDGENVFIGRTVPGNAYEYSGSSSVEILTGNAAALEIYYNLVPVGVIGDIGEVKSLVFTSDTGVITPTPRFSPTTAPTLQPSATMQPTITPTSPPPTPTPSVTPLIP